MTMYWEVEDMVEFWDPDNEDCGTFKPSAARLLAERDEDDGGGLDGRLFVTQHGKYVLLSEPGEQAGMHIGLVWYGQTVSDAARWLTDTAGAEAIGTLPADLEAAVATELSGDAAAEMAAWLTYSAAKKTAADQAGEGALDNWPNNVPIAYRQAVAKAWEDHCEAIAQIVASAPPPATAA